MIEETLVSIDLDDLGCYHHIHGLPEPTAAQAAVVLERALPRILTLLDGLGMRATLFVIGRDLERDQAAGGRGSRWLEQAVKDGHELGNHSYAHAYDLSAWTDSHMRDDLERCDGLLRALGAEVRGFRAPGYTHNRRLLLQVARRGYVYDSSALPSPAYYAAKLGVMSWMALTRRRSASMWGGARSFLGRREPHRLARLGIWEMPMSVTSGLRVPLIGTSVLAGPAWLRQRLLAAARKTPSLHLELHGLDFVDADADDVAAPLRKLQPELRAPLPERIDRLRELLRARPPATTVLAGVERRDAGALKGRAAKDRELNSSAAPP